MATYAVSPDPTALLLYAWSTHATASSPTLSPGQFLNSPGTPRFPFKSINKSTYEIACCKKLVRGHVSWRTNAMKVNSSSPGIAWIALVIQEQCGHTAWSKCSMLLTNPGWVLSGLCQFVSIAHWQWWDWWLAELWGQHIIPESELAVLECYTSLSGSIWVA